MGTFLICSKKGRASCALRAESAAWDWSRAAARVIIEPDAVGGSMKAMNSRISWALVAAMLLTMARVPDAAYLSTAGALVTIGDVDDERELMLATRSIQVPIDITHAEPIEVWRE